MKKQFIALIAAIVILAGFFIAKPFVFDKAGSIETTTTTEWFDDNAITTEKATYEARKSTSRTDSQITTYKSKTNTQYSTSENKTAQTSGINRNGSYYSKDEVALYIHTYGRLPDNFITKNEARALGWEGGSVERYAPGKAIGGDYYGNYEGKLIDGSYHECDINTLGKSSRGPERIVYSTSGVIYYTPDHYETFIRLY